MKKEQTLELRTFSMGATIRFSDPELYRGTDLKPDVYVTVPHGQWMDTADLREVAEVFLVLARRLETAKSGHGS